MDQQFEALVASSAEEHGHLCPGQVVGVRMALLGGKLIGIPVPCQENDIKKVIVWVEMDRCTADAVAHTVGVKLGRRSLKFKDFGIMAATFLNLETGRAFRIISTEESRQLVDAYAPEVAGKAARTIEAYKRMPDCVLFRVQEVRAAVDELDLPGPTRRKVTCQVCGQVVRDGKERVVDGRVLCRPCAGEAYFHDPREVTWDDMAWAPAALPKAASGGRGGG